MLQTRKPAEQFGTTVVRPPDFDAFWAAIMAEVAAIPLNPTMVHVPLRSTAEVDVYAIGYDSLDGIRIAGWYCGMRQDWDDGRPQEVPRAARTGPSPPSGDGQFGHDGRPALLEHAPTVRERDGLARPRHRPEVLALLLEAGAEARRRGEGAEATHRVIALFDAVSAEKQVDGVPK